MKNNIEPLEFIVNAIKKAGYVPGKDIYIAMDPASSEFYNEETKMYELKGDGKNLTSDQMILYYEDMVSKYPIVSIEDALAVVWDRYSVDPTGRDARRIFVDDRISTNEFKAKWPGINYTELRDQYGQDTTSLEGWVDEDSYRVKIKRPKKVNIQPFKAVLKPPR